MAEMNIDGWKQIRAAILAAGEPCAYCRYPTPTEVDHVIPRGQGGSHDAANLVPACDPCNSQKGNRTPDEWRAWRESKGMDWPPTWPESAREPYRQPESTVVTVVDGQRRYVVAGTDVTDHVRANVARFGRIDDAPPETQERLRALFGPVVASVRRGSGPPEVAAPEAA